MDKRIIGLLGLVISCPLLSVPLRLISPKEVNSTTGFVITSTGTYLLSDDVYVNSGILYAIQISSSNVTLDLNGKTIAGDRNGILINSNIGNITIKNGTINGFETGLTNLNNVSDIYIEQLTCINQRDTGAAVSSGQRLYIRNCTFSHSASTCLNVSSVSDVQVSNINIEGSRNGFGLVIDQCSAASFKNVRAIKNPGHGVSCTTSNNLLIEDSLFNQNGFAGVSLDTTSSSIISTCVSYGNGAEGFLINGASGGNIVRSSSAYSNTGTGFSNGASATTLLGNLAFNNAGGNYSGAGSVAFVQVDNGAQVPLGGVTDPRIDNISIS